MIVVIATAVVSVLLHTETDQNAQITAISRRLEKKVFGSGVGRQGRLGHQKHMYFSFLPNENLHCLLGSPQR